MTQATDESTKAFPKVWCRNCDAVQPMKIAVMKADAKNEHDAADILCDECRRSCLARIFDD
jgi:hypothetical protein